MNSLISIFLLVITGMVAVPGQTPAFIAVDPGIRSSIRALSLPGGDIVWAAGSHGWVGRSTDGGKRWKFNRLPGDTLSDYRTLYAHDSLQAILGNTGSPAILWYTSDGGKSWKEVYRNSHPQAFLDGIGFWDEKHGIVYGDPIAKRILILTTSDGGKSWQESSPEERPEVVDGEASFAASGTTIRCNGDKDVWIATGGMRSSLYRSTSRGKRWRRYETPMLHGKSSTGTFSIEFMGNNKIALAGGDYLDEQSANGNYCIGKRGKTWILPLSRPGGYRSTIEAIGAKAFLAAGPSGADLSTDGGYSWHPIDAPKGINVVRKSRDGNLVMAGGRNNLWIIKVDDLH